eukprot:750636-Hanusia_phi.AAC.12
MLMLRPAPMCSKLNWSSSSRSRKSPAGGQLDILSSEHFTFDRARHCCSLECAVDQAIELVLPPCASAWSRVVFLLPSSFHHMAPSLHGSLRRSRISHASSSSPPRLLRSTCRLECAEPRRSRGPSGRQREGARGRRSSGKQRRPELPPLLAQVTEALSRCVHARVNDIELSWARGGGTTRGNERKHLQASQSMIQQDSEIGEEEKEGEVGYQSRAWAWSSEIEHVPWARSYRTRCQHPISSPAFSGLKKWKLAGDVQDAMFFCSASESVLPVHPTSSAAACPTLSLFRFLRWLSPLSVCSPGVSPSLSVPVSTSTFLIGVLKSTGRLLTCHSLT